MTFTLAPKAETPLLDVPTPLWMTICEAELVKSGTLTKNVPWLSESLYGTPFIMMLIAVPETPRILNPVYPTPFPASEVEIMEV